MYKVIPTYNSTTGVWSETSFETIKDYLLFVNSKYKRPGEYNLRNTESWIQSRTRFLKTGGFDRMGKYCEHVKNTRKYEDFWKFEGIKCRKGVIIDDYFLTGYYYDYLNYSPIYDKVKSEINFAEIWDSDYHTFLYIERCILYGENVLCLKKRQWGWSLKMMSIFKNDFVFAKSYTNKIITKEEPQLEGTWEIFLSMLNFTNEHTGWYRQRTGSGYSLEQTYEGKIGNKKIKKGRKNITRGVMTKQSATRSVGGKCHPAGTRILTTKGFKKVEDITTSDLVIGIDGLPKSVLALTKGYGKIYKVNYEDFEPLYVSEGHKLALYMDMDMQGNYGVKGTPIETVIRRLNDSPIHFKRENFPIRIKEAIFFEEREVLIDPFLLGCFLGNPKQHDLGELSVKKKIDSLSKSLAKYKLFKKRVIPGEYLYNSKKIRLALLQGLIATCGKLDIINGAYYIDSGDKDLTKQIYMLSLSLGFDTNLRTYPVENKPDRCECVIYILKDHELSGDLEDLTYDKNKDTRPSRATTNGKLKSVEFVRNDDYYGFECEGHYYVVEDYQITHNCNKAFFEEAGVNSSLDVSYGYLSPALRQGSVRTGTVFVGGSVGELKDCAPLRRYAYKPQDNGFLGEPDIVHKDKIVGYFVPVYWNYIHEIRDREDPNIILGAERCYDKDGNSDIKRAKELLSLEDAKQARKAPAEYALWKSQNPSTLDDLFGARDNNIFPTSIISPHELWLEENYKPLIVNLHRGDKGKIYHELANKQLVTDFPIKPSSFKEGALCITEVPSYTPFGLYVAGVDPISSVKSHKYQTSLFSIYIYRLSHEMGGKFIPGKIVGWYTGRYDNPQTTYNEALKLIEFFNARAVIESDNKAFIDWMIQERQQEYMVKRSEIPILKELLPNSNIGDEYGLRMGSGELNIVKKYCFEKLIEFCEEQIGNETLIIDDEEVNKVIYGVSRIPDQMLCKEMLDWDEKLNTDRLIAASIAVMYGRLLESRNIFYKLKESEKENKPQVNYSQPINNLLPSYRLPAYSRFNKKQFRLK